MRSLITFGAVDIRTALLAGGRRSPRKASWSVAPLPSLYRYMVVVEQWRHRYCFFKGSSLRKASWFVAPLPSLYRYMVLVEQWRHWYCFFKGSSLAKHHDRLLSSHPCIDTWLEWNSDGMNNISVRAVAEGNNGTCPLCKCVIGRSLKRVAPFL